MKVSIVWLLSDLAEENLRSYSCLSGQEIPDGDAAQLLVYAPPGSETDFYRQLREGERTSASAAVQFSGLSKEAAAEEEGDDNAEAGMRYSDEQGENTSSDDQSPSRRGASSKGKGREIGSSPLFSNLSEWQFFDHRADEEAPVSGAQVCNALIDEITGDYLTVLEKGDIWSEGSLAAVCMAIHEHPGYDLIMLQKIHSDGMPGPFSTDMDDPEQRSRILDLDLDVFWSRYPWYFPGTFLRTDLFRERPFRTDLGMESEREYFLRICAAQRHLLYLPEYMYCSGCCREGHDSLFEGIYQTQWYEESFDDFWLPFLGEMQETYGEVPPFIQYHFMFSVKCRLNANWNNRNKHVARDGEVVLGRIGRAMRYIGDDALFNARKMSECVVPDSLKWVYGILKYGPDFRFQKLYHAGAPYYGASGILFNRIRNLKTNLVFMDYLDGNLEIDATIHPILYSMADRIYFAYENERYAPVYNERYAHTKTLGVSIYKSHSCHVSIPLPAESEGVLYCFANVGGERIRINFSYESHFSRMSPNFKNTYWQFGEKDQYFYMLKRDGGLQITPCEKDSWKEREKILEREMRRTHKKRDRLFWYIRKAYFAVRPFLKKKPIWMYLDKIYKGGDSAEYLYKYACRQDNDFRHYYLIDKHSADYKRLIKEGYKPLVRGSIKHRLVFLLADMMVISNSTVFAFNDFPMRNSRFVRDLTDFHVCCVQHGMSVQKIAVAQNRFRDNTRLYFCASKYEIENLSKPIYGYEGTDALKLTGVPRYDGLIDRAVKQIMISPTWRMQAAVPVASNQNEGQQRDYNPLFKESDYFRVYNALINDERLIGAAKEYGYRIKYVLHPIVSSQVGDFDQNDYVDIIPAVGDMSYEDMFCESALMVTDFSGIQFDFAYMRKPVVYLHHKDIPQHYEEGTFFYDTMGFGEICHDNDELIDLLIEYMRTGCHMKEEYVKRADDFFYYDDHDNCKRIYETMVEYQEEHILKNR